MDQS
jgi:hypothetical protein